MYGRNAACREASRVSHLRYAAAWSASVAKSVAAVTSLARVFHVKPWRKGSLPTKRESLAACRPYLFL
jgi:hypothetical protein